ncbi:hypothetical protein OG394_03880 [Kribbella sp. NBC_01245]|uniref:hypothetical protein n=1 Tax=Kribbella sp. NBC_01245 TaxID=2903578 RepID=UPI002E27B4D9|nr:hypothetical protein [Kribbella sp. NBC_01245]
MATGVVVVGSTPASAHKAGHVSVKSSLKVRPPLLKRPRVRCHESGAIVVITLRNRSRTALHFEVRLSAGEYQEALPVMLLPRGTDSVEFHGVPDGSYLTEVLNDVGEYVADRRFRVSCNAAPAPADHRRTES